MTDQTTLQAYEDAIQGLSLKCDDHSIVLQDITDLIESQMKGSIGHPVLESFFQAELAFFSAEYKKALNHYKDAKGCPNRGYYCYRATAFACQEVGKDEEALRFVEKALALCPDDFFCLSLQRDLLKARNSGEDAAKIEDKIEALRSQGIDFSAEDVEEEEEIVSEGVQVAQEELDDINKLFFVQEMEPHSVTSPEEVVNVIQEIALEEMGEEAPNDISKEFDLLDGNVENSTADTPELEEEEMDEFSLSDLPSLDLESEDLDFPDVQLSSEEEFSFAEQAESTELPEKTEDDDLDLDEWNLETSLESEEEVFALPEPIEAQGISVAEDTLESRLAHFQNRQQEMLETYSAQSTKRPKVQEDILEILNGWTKEARASEVDSPFGTPLSCDREQTTTGGYFIRWRGRGIVVNPGPQFLSRFHEQGHYIKDVDYVIVTRHHPKHFEDLKAIYDLNARHNGISDDRHVIHYCLNQDSYRAMASALKPNFKQERNSVHCLELFVDSPEVESLSLGPEISLSYFRPQSPEDDAKQILPKAPAGNTVGIRLDLMNETGHCDTSIGFVSGLPWNPSLAEFFQSCQIILAGFERTRSVDYKRLQYNEDSLGYFGCYSLLENTQPQILICCEYGGEDGDIRLEAAKKLSQEHLEAHRRSTVVLPGDTGLAVHLTPLRIACSISGSLIDAEQVHVVKTQDAFGSLRYLSPLCIM